MYHLGKVAWGKPYRGFESPSLRQNMQKAIIFDWSGTLSDNFHCFCEVCDLMFNELGREKISPEEIRLNFTLPYMKFWNHYFPDLSKELQCELYEKYIHQVSEPKLYDGVEDFIKKLKEDEWSIFILSSDPISKLALEIERSGLLGFFTKVIGNIHEKSGVLKEIVKEFNLDKKMTYYVGDTSGDVEAGKTADIMTVGISWGFQHKSILEQSKPDFLIDSIGGFNLINF